MSEEETDQSDPDRRLSMKTRLFKEAKELHTATGDFVSVTWQHSNGLEKASYISTDDTQVDSQKPDGDVSDLAMYKYTLRKVLKEQIQYLVEQLSEKAGEETVVLSASLSDGTLSSLGSKYGRCFIQREKDIGSKFQTFCVKKTSEGSVGMDDSNKENLFLQLKRSAAESMVRPHFSPTVDEPPQKVRKAFIGGNVGTVMINSHTVHPSLAVANSDYLQKLKSTVGIPALSNVIGERKDGLNDNYPNSQNSFLTSASTEASMSDTRMNQDLDMSIVKVERDDGGFEVENCGSNLTGRRNGDKVDSSDSESNQAFDEYIKYQATSQAKFPLGFTDNGPFFASSVPGGSSLQDSIYIQGNSINSFNRSGMGPNFDTPYRVYKCQFCDKEFREKTNLRVHLRTHTGEKPYHCGICGKDFAHSSNLKQHERGVHRLPPRMPQYKQHFYNELSKMIDNSAGMGFEMMNQSMNQKMVNQSIFPGSNMNNNPLHIQEGDNSNQHGQELIGQPVIPRTGQQGHDLIGQSVAPKTNQNADLIGQLANIKTDPQDFQGQSSPPRSFSHTVNQPMFPTNQTMSNTNGNNMAVHNTDNLPVSNTNMMPVSNINNIAVSSMDNVTRNDGNNEEQTGLRVQQENQSATVWDNSEPVNIKTELPDLYNTT